MFEVKQLFCFADPVFFDDVSRWNHGAGLLPDGEFGVSGRPVPAGWTRRSRSVWVYLDPGGTDLPAQGWKIHVSATLDNADKLCTVVWDYCVEHRVPFKHLLNRNVLLAMNAKYAARGASGKLLTVYPRDEAELTRVLVELNEVCGGEPGPYILSDLRFGDGPLYARYGGFVTMETLDADGDWTLAVRDPAGRLVPDQRRPSFSPPDWAPLPEVLRPHLAARRRGDGKSLPYRVRKALHFSNAGGVYIGERIDDGRKVVLKEARPYAGWDENHDDCVTRQARERRALERLRGVDGVPELYDSFVAGGHHFLVQEFVEGQPLHVWYAVNHPWVVRTDPTPDELAAYTRRALEIVDGLERLVERIHDRGVVFNDLHLGNVMIRPDGSVALVDFELAADVTEDWRPGMRATGFGTRAKVGFAHDRHSLAAIRLGIFLTLSRISALEPAKVLDFVRVLEDNFPVPPGWTAPIRAELAPPPAPDGTPAEPPSSILRRVGVDFEAPTVNWDAVRASIRRAIITSATPERAERLYPGAPEQFGPGGGIGFAYGAAGVLWTLAETRSPADPEHPSEHEDWLLAAVDRATTRGPGLRPGFYDGAAGIAFALDRLGHHERADAVLDGSVGDVAGLHGMSLFNGLPGIGATLLHFASRRGSTAYEKDAVEIAGRLVDAVHSADPVRLLPPGRAPSAKPVRAGLMRGWSGVALFLCRLYEHTGDAGYLDAAVRAVHHDLDGCVTTRDGALMFEEAGVRVMPYLETGSAGIALVSDELLRLRDDERIRTSLPQLLIAARRLFAVQADLFTGFASQVAALARLSHRFPLDAAVDRHLRNLSWHALTHQGELTFPGSLGFRLSMDFATGSAGVLLAIAAATTRPAPYLPFFSAPRARSGT